MDKKTAYKVISQFRANNCKSGALDEALKALKPIAVNQVFCIKLEILDSGNYYHSKAAQSTLWLEASNNKKKMQAHIAEWRSKVVERCKDNTTALLSLTFIMGVLIISRQTSRIVMSYLFTLKVNTTALQY